VCQQSAENENSNFEDVKGIQNPERPRFSFFFPDTEVNTLGMNAKEIKTRM
jgi:hypothetical protein